MQNSLVTIELFDTTLRDGLQGLGATTTLVGELAIAQSLIEANLTVIEAGCSASSAKEYSRIEQIVQMAKNTSTKVAVFAIANEVTIQSAQQVLQQGKSTDEISLLTSVGEHHLQSMFTGKNYLNDSIEHYKYFVALAASNARPVHVYLEDATRADRAYLQQLIPELCQAGATTISVPDTTGCVYTPEVYGDLIAFVCNLTPQSVQVSAHTHNDLGLALANAQAAVRSGATRVEGTCMGWGERIGNLPLEQFAYTMFIAPPALEQQYTTTVCLPKLGKAILEFVERSGVQVWRKQPLFGGDAFVTKAGIHQAKILKNPATYFAIHPEKLGFAAPLEWLAFGRGTGRNAVVSALQEYGYTHCSKADVGIANTVQIVQELAEHTHDGVLEKPVVVALALNEVGDNGEWKFVQSPEYKTLASNVGECLEVTLQHTTTTEVVRISQVGTGGLIALFCRGLMEALNVTFTIKDEGWQSHNIGDGENSYEFIKVRLQAGEKYVTGLGIDRDSNKAGFKAVLHAINRLIAS